MEEKEEKNENENNSTLQIMNYHSFNDLIGSEATTNASANADANDLDSWQNNEYDDVINQLEDDINLNDDDFKLPDVNWESLEAKLREANEEFKSQVKTLINYRFLIWLQLIFSLSCFRSHIF